MEPRWIWPFELLEKIGEGGMGIVYRARYTGNDRIVAVKLLPSDVAADSVLLARFERELDVLKQLHHPHIVRCFGGTCESSERFYAMELIEGGTLADLLGRKGKLAWETVVDFGLQICEALQYAHEHGVIHRDIKPGNFLITKSGQLKLSDFGLASVVTTNRLTAAGRTVGTIQYMAPEQIRGKGLTGRVDLYAMGCVLYEMLTGHTPYRGEHAAAILQQHLGAPIPHAMEEAHTCPLKLDELIFELMSKDPDQRPATAAEVGWRLEEILQPGRHSTPVEPDLFPEATTQTRVAPLQNLNPLPSDAVIEVPQRRTFVTLFPWLVVVCMIMATAGLWSRWSSTVRQLHHAEQMWVELFEHSDPAVRVLAATSLADFGPLQASTIQKLIKGTHDPRPEVRVAALRAVERHTSECRIAQGEIFQIEKLDEDPNVRFQASLVLEAMKQVRTGLTSMQIFVWLIILSLLIAIAAGIVIVWRKLRPIANS